MKLFNGIKKTPRDQYWEPIHLVMTQDNWYTLRLEHIPDYTWSLFGLMVDIMAAILIVFIEPIYLIVPAIYLAYILYAVYMKRNITCVMNKQIGKADLVRGGFLGTRYDQKIIRFDLSEIKRLEMQRHVQGGRYTDSADMFQIVALLDKEKRIELTSGNLGFAECQEFAEKIRLFMEMDIPIKAVD